MLKIYFQGRNEPLVFKRVDEACENNQLLVNAIDKKEKFVVLADYDSIIHTVNIENINFIEFHIP